MKKLKFFLVVFIFFGMLFGIWYFFGLVRIDFPNFSGQKSSVQDEEFATVVRVIDGDTVELSDGRRVRYVGINTPEIEHGGQKGECFGEEAKQKNKELVEGKEVRLVRDVSEKDKYGRWLYLVFIENRFVEEILIREGYARVMTMKPDVRYAQDIAQWVREAKGKNAGLWGVCPL